MENQKDISKKWYIQTSYNVKGDVEKTEYFMDYDEVLSKPFNLGKRDNIVVTRNGQTGIPTNQTIVTQLIKGGEVYDSDTMVIKFTKTEGITFNQNSRQNLINAASEYLLYDLILEYGDIDGLSKAKQFLDSVINERNKYILGIISELITAITGSPLPFMTPIRKNKLVEILNVSY